MPYINQVFCKHLPQRQLKRTPRERFTIYQKDLHRIARSELSESTLIEGDQYNYTELGNAVLEPIEHTDILNDIDITIFCYWTPEFDPDYSAFGPYFMERYKLSGHSFDVCDNGSLASATSLIIAKDYLNSGDAQKILLLGLEQNTIPRNFAEGLPIPSGSRSIAALLTSDKRPESQWQLLNCGQITEWDSISNQDYCALIEKILFETKVQAKDVVLLTNRTSFFFKKLRFEIETKQKEFPISLAFLRPCVTGMNTLLTLAGETLSPLNKQIVLLIDQDVESLRMAWSVLHRLRDIDNV